MSTKKGKGSDKIGKSGGNTQLDMLERHAEMIKRLIGNHPLPKPTKGTKIER